MSRGIGVWLALLLVLCACGESGDGDRPGNSSPIAPGLADVTTTQAESATSATPVATSSSTTRPTSTTMPLASATSAATPPVAIADFNPDADGNDNQNKNGEWIDIRNQGSIPVDLSDWTLEDEGPNHTYRFPPGFTLEPGSTVRVFTGCGSDTQSELYWCNSGSAIWNNDGDTATLRDNTGVEIDQSSY